MMIPASPAKAVSTHSRREGLKQQRQASAANRPNTSPSLLSQEPPILVSAVAARQGWARCSMEAASPSRAAPATTYHSLLPRGLTPAVCLEAEVTAPAAGRSIPKAANTAMPTASWVSTVKKTRGNS